jgi:hypothetical protein
MSTVLGNIGSYIKTGSTIVDLGNINIYYSLANQNVITVGILDK